MTAISRRARAATRARRSAPALDGIATGAEVRVWLGRGIEAAWLVAAIVTPLIVLSESAFLSKTELPKVATVRISAGVIVLLLLADAGLSIWRRSLVIPRRPLDQLMSVLSARRGDARAWVIASVVGVIATTAIASAFALLPRLSTWGADPGADGNSLYSTIAYAVLFFAVATRVRTRSQVWRLLAAMVVTGTLAALIGIAQYFGHAPFGIRSTSGSIRVSGTAGNPIFFATILTVTLILAIGMSLSIRELTRKTVGWLSIYGLVIAVHMTALLVTLSRGPWMGAVAGLVAIAALAPILFGRRRAALTGLTTGIAFLAALTFLATTSYSPPSPPELVEAATTSGTAGAVGRGGIERTSVADIQDRVTTLTGVFDSDTNARIARWDGALDLALDRPVPPVGAQPGYLMRSLFGYGPDTYPDVFTMVAPKYLSRVRSTAAHNDPLNRLVETGLIGLLAWTALWSSLAILILRNLWVNRNRAGAGQVVVLVIGAALAAWFVAALTGIPKSGDSVLIWLLAGLAVAAPRVFSAANNEAAEIKSWPPATSGAVRASAAVAVGVMALATIWITWGETVQRLSADSSAASAVNPAPAASSGSSVSGRLKDIDRAISLAPDQARYHTIRSEIYEQIAAEPGSPDSLSAMEEAAASAERALALNPLDRDLNFRAAFLDWELAKMGDMDAALRTYELYRGLAVLTPQHPNVGPRLAAIGETLGFAP